MSSGTSGAGAAIAGDAMRAAGGMAAAGSAGAAAGVAGGSGGGNAGDAAARSMPGGTSGRGSASGAGAGGATIGVSGSGMAGAGGGAAMAGSGMAGAGGAAGGSCNDACPAAHGVAIDCAKRFMFGVNYAWINFGDDFGGGARGIAQNRSAARQDLEDMKANGVDVIRWWMHPVFFNGGVGFDGSGMPTGLGGSELADIDAALSLAAEVGVHLKLTLFSFDNFRDDASAGHGLNPVVSDATKRKALIDNAVRPIARAVSGNANAARMLSWDVINEPEWAISGDDGYGDQAFDPTSGLQSVSFSVMETFVREAVSALHEESGALVTVGQAAVKWSHAFTKVGLDYYDMHYYGWVDQYFPLGGKSLDDYGIGDKPVVVGEFPLDGWSNPNGTLDAGQILGKLFDLGYAGAKAWAFTKDGNWAGNKGKLQSFAMQKGCVVAY